MHIMISYDFPPKVGGAHFWLYEVYRRWPTNVNVLTARYSDRHDEAERQHKFDSLDHGSIRIFRRAILRNISIIEPRVLFAFFRQARCIADLGGTRNTCLHALRAFPEGFAALIYCKCMNRRCRLVTYAHGEEVLIARTSVQLSLVARWVYSRSDLVIANSENTKHLVNSISPDARVTCINPGVDTKAYRYSALDIERIRNSWGWPNGTVVISTVARMELRKNQRTVMEAVGKLRAEGLPLAYVCAGDGEERSNLLELAGRLELHPWIKFTGEVSDEEKRMIFAASDIHAMPSIQIGEMIEGFGLVFLEAAAAGVPSICGDSGGQSEAVVHGKTGLVVQGGNLASVVDAIKVLAMNFTLRTDMGAAARNWVQILDWEKVKDRTQSEIARIAPESFAATAGA